MSVNGLVVMTPTSIASTGTGNSSSIGANGKVTFSSCVTLSLNGVFTSSYDNYMVALSGYSSSSGGNVKFRLRVSGTDNSTANSYVHQNIKASSTTVSGTRTTTDETLYTVISSTYANGATMFIFGPALTQPTAGRSVTAVGASGATIEDYAWTHNQSTAYDGFTLDLSAGATGSITVYGFNQ